MNGYINFNAHDDYFGLIPSDLLMTRQLTSLLCGLCLCTPGLAQSSSYSMADFDEIEKIDIHVHIHNENLDFVSLSRRDRFRFVNMAVWSDLDPQVNAEKHRTTFLQYKAAPDRLAPVVSFPLENWDAPDWTDQTIAYLDEMFKRGAVGVKVWKNIGMVLRDKTGKLVMIDDPKFDRVFEHLRVNQKVLLGHLGEPKNCWLPLDEMTTNNDRSYFAEHPKYHMYLHPELPGYEDQIAARDRMLDKHPQLQFVACHLGSLEWSIDEMSNFLQRYPNVVLGVAARMGQIQYQSHRDRQRVIDFFIQYQDRLLYGTDTGVGPKTNAAEAYEQVRYRWLRDWKYFNTEQYVEVPELDNPIQGLALPKSVVDKVYRENARRIFSTSWPNS
ncbi:MAG: amidohydrolase family protein [Pirellulaceae bacterium]